MTGSGTQEDPYIIYDVDDLQAMENNLAAHYELANNIDASATTGWNGGAGFDPIGKYYDTKFTGSFDGKGHVISGLFINRPTDDGIALFGCTGNGCGAIQNVGIVDCNITGEYEVAALIGFQDDLGGAISNCYSTGSITGIQARYNMNCYFIAGLIGYASPSSMSDCYSTCTISATCTSTGISTRGKVSECGGLIGGLYRYTTVTRCYATGNISATSLHRDVEMIGGFIGHSVGTTVTRCYATGDISAIADEEVGGIGGFVGEDYSNSVSDCYARGDVTLVAGTPAASWGRIGGFCGYTQDAVIDNCYSTGLLTVTALVPRVGGFCGDSYSTITDCFWDEETSGTSESDGGTGKTTAEMKTASTFNDAGWDFATIWTICSGINSDYPCLIDITPSCTGPILIPTATTDPATELVAIEANLNGTLDGDGGEACDCGFEWGKDVPYGNTTPSESKTAGQTFSQPITELQPKTTYRFRAFATNSAGTSYGTIRTFTTPASLPVITTNPATGTSALNGTLGDDGGEACGCGFEWGETEAYGNTTPVQSRRTGQSILQTIGELLPDTTYHFRAFATNSRGTDYGADRSFSTPAALPTATTNPATELGAIEANLNGTLDDDGGEACECGFEFGLDPGYGTITATESKTTDQTFSQVIGGLVPNTTYHFRAFATNSSGTGYGADRTFTTALIISRAFALAREEL